MNKTSSSAVNAAGQEKHGKKGNLLQLFQHFRQSFPDLCAPDITGDPATGQVHTSLDLLLWFQRRYPTASAFAKQPSKPSEVLVSQTKKGSACWTWPEVTDGTKIKNLGAGLFYIANTLHVDDRDPEHWRKPAKRSGKSRLMLLGTCIRTNETRAFPDNTYFVFCDLETYYGDDRVIPEPEERRALLRYCRDHAAFACGWSPHGLHTVLVFNRPVCVADPDPTNEMERAVRWFFRDFQAGRWRLDPCSWARTRKERACPLLFWHETAVVALPAVLPDIAPAADPAPSNKKKSTKYSHRKAPSLSARGGNISFLGKAFSGSNAAARATESNICLCRIAGMSVSETAELTGESESHVQVTWRQVSLPLLPPNHAAAIRAKIFRKGKPLRSAKRRPKQAPHGLPAHWIDAPKSWFNPGEDYVKTSSSFKYRRATESFARSFGHSLQKFGDAGYQAEQAYVILLYWMALIDLGLGAHAAMQVVREWANLQFKVPKEVCTRSQRCLNWSVSWLLFRLFDDLRKEFSSRKVFHEFLLPELRNLAKQFWGKIRNLKPISGLAAEVIEYGVLFHLKDHTHLKAVRSQDVVNKTRWDWIPRKYRWKQPREVMAKHENIIDIGAPTRTEVAKTKMVQRYFRIRGYKNKIPTKLSGQRATGGRQKRGSPVWQLPRSLLGILAQYRENARSDVPVAQEPVTTERRTFTSVDRGGREGEDDVLCSGDFADLGAKQAEAPASKAIIWRKGRTFTIGGEEEGWRGGIRLPNLSEDLDEILGAANAAELKNPLWNWTQEEVNDALGKPTQASVWQEVLPPALCAVRAVLANHGHTCQDGSELTGLLAQLCSKAPYGRPQALLNELVISGLVVDVSRWAEDGEKLFGWRRYIEGEAAFARNVVAHSKGGGKGEVIYGDPGTGKTHAVAQRVAAGNFQRGYPLLIGSAQNNSALTLQERLRALKDGHNVYSVHKAYSVMVDPELFQPELRLGLLVADEVGQLDAYTAGAMSSRWAPKSNVVLSVGPNQLYPVGPGKVGEDLIACLQRKGLKGWNLNQLTENWRTKEKSSSGIVDFFTAVKQGKMGHEGPGLILKAVPLSHTWDTLCTIGMVTGATLRKDMTSLDDPVACFFPTDWTGAEASAMKLKEKLGLPKFRPGEKLRIREVRKCDYAQNLRKGEIVEFVSMDADDELRVKTLSRDKDQLEVVLPRTNLRSNFCLTGHAAQGMEIDYGVVVVLDTRVTNRRWLFSAISRCRKKCIVVYRAGPGRDELENYISENPERLTLFPKFFHHFRNKFGV